MIIITVRGPRSMAPCVARDRWHRAWWPAINGTVRGPRSCATNDYDYDYDYDYANYPATHVCMCAD